jgi:hypothetical protein
MLCAVTLQAWKIIKDDRKCYARPLCTVLLHPQAIWGQDIFRSMDCLCLSSAWENHVRTCGNKLNILLPFESPVNLNTNIFFSYFCFVRTLGPITINQALFPPNDSFVPRCQIMLLFPLITNKIFVEQYFFFV